MTAPYNPRKKTTQGILSSFWVMGRCSRAVGAHSYKRRRSRIVGTYKTSTSRTLRRKKARGMDHWVSTWLWMKMAPNDHFCCGEEGKAPCWQKQWLSPFKGDIRELQKLQDRVCITLLLLIPELSSCPYPVSSCCPRTLLYLPSLPPHTSAPRELQHPFLCMYLSCKKATLVTHFQTHQHSCST